MSLFVSDQPVFFVDDDPDLREANVQALELAGMRVRAFADAESALAEIDSAFEGALVTDIRMPRMDGLQLFARIRALDEAIPVILITGHADVPTAVAALRDGAFDFLAKPFAPDHLVNSVTRALQTRLLVVENRRLRAEAQAETDSPLIGDSLVMARLRETIVQVARADIDVLVEGETGTGKELVALLLHRKGPRAGRPFVAVNSGALPESLAETELFGHDLGGPAGIRAQPGRIEASSGGTLFLDEVDSMVPAVQAKLLRVLEEREVLPIGAERPRAVNLHVVAASKRSLERVAQDGGFRHDLFYRLNVVRLRIPPLRERREDVPQLFAHFVDAATTQIGAPPFQMDDGVRRQLIEHDWPGNVRELRNFAYGAVLNLKPEAVGPAAPVVPLAERVERFEASAVRDALRAAGGDIRETMARLALARKTLYDKLTRHGIEPNDYRTKS